MSEKISYTAIEQFGKKNQTMYGLSEPSPKSSSFRFFDKTRIKVREVSGEITQTEEPISDLERGAIEFIRDRCIGLGFKHDDEHMELKDNDGKSLKPNQIPYNVECDINRRCLEVAIHRFMRSGLSKDAFDIYFIYLELFMGGYGATRKMIEMLSEFEANASSLLMKHRDHYSHSVYVFILGLAYYNSSKSYRKAYMKKFGRFVGEAENCESEKLAASFLEYWGLTSLFHDIGYPFELSFEQIKSYFSGSKEQDGETPVPYIQFNMNTYLSSRASELIEKEKEKLLSGKLSEEERKKAEESIDVYTNEKNSAIEILNKMRGELCEKSDDDNLNVFLADILTCYLKDFYEGKDKKYYLDELLKKPDPAKCSNFLDHAYFSAVILTVNLIKIARLANSDKANSKKIAPCEMHAAAISAILLHNSFYKFSVTNVKGKNNEGKHFSAEINPLAFLLMLCDELQCWDRTSYGQNSRGQIHPFNCVFQFDGDKIKAEYVFDSKFFELSSETMQLKNDYKNQEKSFNKYAKGGFVADIEDIVSINGDHSHNLSSFTSLDVKVSAKNDNRYRSAYLSSSNFMHLYQFAIKVHQLNHLNEYTEEEMFKKFNELSLEYKMTHIGRAKKYDRYLYEIGCFFSDKPTDLEILTEINDEFLEKMGALEHDRWCFDHYVMGWTDGKEYLGKENEGNVRERIRMHKDMINVSDGEYKKEDALKHYRDTLTDKDREKDKRSMNNLLKVLDREDGIKVYRIR